MQTRDEVTNGKDVGRKRRGRVGAEQNVLLMMIIFFFARSCLGKVPGRAPFSQLSQRATACTIRMQIVKHSNENELDIKKRNNQLGQLISK